MVPIEIEELIIKYLKGTASEKQISELQSWYQNTDLSQVDLKELTHQELEATGIRMRTELQAYTKSAKNTSSAFGKWLKVAAILILIIAGLWWLRDITTTEVEHSRIAAIINLPPGRTGAVLKLDDGKTILLDSSSNGLIASQSGVRIIKNAAGITYKGASSKPAYNTISTQKGRMWAMVLPDGTKVWLNSASSIRFPLSFKGTERVVQLTGEAYFEVVHNARMPFRVEVGNQRIEDLGTSFNINAYGDNQNVITTLIEGSLRIDSKQLNCVLVPGEQARIGKDNIVCEVSRMQTVTSWKEGYFDFYDADLKQMLQQIGRWYDIDVTYRPGLTREKFTGRFPKDLTLGNALEILKQAGINFSFEPGKDSGTKSIIVSPI